MATSQPHRISSTSADATVVRAHPDIETGAASGADVALNEEQALGRKDHGPENPALLRRLALNSAKLEPSEVSTRGRLKRASRDDPFLAAILAQFAHPQMLQPCSRRL